MRWVDQFAWDVFILGDFLLHWFELVQIEDYGLFLLHWWWSIGMLREKLKKKFVTKDLMTHPQIIKSQSLYKISEYLDMEEDKR